MPNHFRALVVAVAILAASCGRGSGSDGGSPSLAPTERMQAVLASSDVYAGAPQRISVGLVFGDGRLVSFGEVEMRFVYTGTQSAPIDPEPGPSATAVYIPTPGTANGEGPRPTNPSEGRGVFEARDVTFDRAGIWYVEVTAELPEGTQSAQALVPVDSEARLPAPGQDALATENLVLRDDGTASDDAPLGALDSRAVTTQEIPDPELHRWTIARAIAEGRPVLVVFATPVYCVSQFCGPTIEVIEDLAASDDSDAVFIHIEIWRDFEEQAINQAAADWLYRNQNLTEPWLYLIGRDGKIIDRWTPLFDPEEVRAELAEAVAAPAPA